ncbi:MAG: putative peptidoglycan glycosyltransferase FtsW [Candidatus Saccharimonadales bacterium]
MMRRQRVGAKQSDQPLSSPRKHRPDYKIVLFAGLLVLIGIVVLFAISPYQIHRLNEAGGNVDQNHYMLKQGLYLVAGASAFVFAVMTPLTWWRRFAPKLLLTAISICVLLALLGAAKVAPAMCYNGACRWYDFGVMTFQPAEFLKFAILLFASGFLGRRIKDGTVNDAQETLVPMAIIIAVASLLVIGLQKDMGTGLTIIGMLASMIFVAGLRLRLIALSAGVAVLAGVMFILISPHRLERVTTFVGSASTDAASYHIDMAKLAIGSGGLVGRGLGNGVQAFGYLPEALNDSIFAVLGETFGFVGLLGIITLFVALLYRILRMADRLSDPTMRMIAAGVFGWIGTHVIINIGAMTGILPLTGVTLPFLSFGGTSLLFVMMSLGLAYHVSQYTSHQVERREVDETSRSGRRFGRPRYTSARSHQ